MRHNFKLVIWILILVGLFYLLVRFFNLGPYANLEPCPSDQCTFSDDKDSVDRSLSQQESNRIVQDFFQEMPEGFPPDMPVDPSPVRVVASYTEVMEGDRSEDELSHLQITYAYVTNQGAKATADAFEKYLQANSFKVSKEDGQSLSTIFGELEQQNIAVNITIANQNQFERLVTISIIAVEKIQTQK